MFLPYPLNFQNFTRTPVVWIFLAFNFFGFLSLVEDSKIRTINQFLFEPQIMIYVGETYFDEVLNVHNERNAFGSSALTRSQKVWIGIQALRDQRFLGRIDQLVFTEDFVLDKKIKKELHTFKEEHLQKSSYFLGLHPGAGWKSYLTYQLTHADFMHLLSNMVFLFGIGFFLEMAIGSLGFTLLYLMCGICGGLLFNVMNPNTFMPMIGASGSISGLLIFYALYEKRKNIRYAFFLSPLREHHGFIYAPVWWIFVFYLATDFAQIISAPGDFSTGVAYTAHAGGALMGMSLALLWNFVFDRREAAAKGVLSHSDGL